MRKLNVSISESEYKRLGLTRDKLSFSEFVAIVHKEVSLQTLEDSVALAEKYGLNEMSMDEITQEVKAVRKHTKDEN